MSVRMNGFEQLALAGHCMLATLRQLGRGGLWVPWLALGVLQGVALLMLAWFAHPWVSVVMAPLVTWLAGADALHYPSVFRVLPALHARAAFVVDALFGVVAIGAATRLFAARFANQPIPAGEGLRSAAGHWGTLLIAHLPLQLLVLGLSFGIPEWLHARGSSGVTLRLAILAGFGGALVIQVIFAMIAPLVMLAGLGVRDTWHELPSMVPKIGVAAVAIAVVATVINFPAQMLGRFADRIVDRGAPELVIALVALQVAVGLFAAFLTAGSITLVYQSLVGDTGDEW
jgi:hypothetical protein